MACRCPAMLSCMVFRLLLLCGVLMAQDAPQPTLTTERRGSEFGLPCPDALTTDAELLYWLKDGQEIANAAVNSSVLVQASTSQSLPNVRLDNTTFMLLVNSSAFEDSGLYMCRGVRGLEARQENDISANSSSALNSSSAESNATAAQDVQQEVFSRSYKVTVNDVPEQPPGPPVVEALGPYTLQVSWQPSENDNNSPIASYNIYVKEIDMRWDGAISVQSETNSTIVRGLSPYTSYQVRVSAQNSVGESLLSEHSRYVKTHSTTPSSSAKPRIDNTTAYANAIYVSFHPPPEHTLNGELDGYVVIAKKEDANEDFRTVLYEPGATEYNFTGLSPNSLYMITINAFNNNIDQDGKEGPPVEIAVFTKESVPSKPKILDVTDRSSSEFILKWERPDQRNGVLRKYYIYVKKDDKLVNRTAVQYNETRIEIPATDQHIFNHLIYGLEPYTDYTIHVSAATASGEGEKSDSYPARTDVTGPSAPLITNLTSNSTHSFTVEWTRPDIFYKPIDKYLIKYRKLGSNFYDEASIFGVKPDTLTPEVKEIAPGKARVLVAIMIDQLQAGTEYEVQVAGATKSIFSPEKYFIGAYSDARTVSVKAADVPIAPMESLTAGVLAGIVCTALLVILAIIALCFMRKYMARTYTFIADPESSHAHNAVVTLPETFDVERDALIVNDFIAHTHALHADTDLGFSQEYEEINRNVRGDLTADASQDPENKHKNRYINILAYDHSRVKLHPTPGPKVKHSDYLNANFVDGYQSQRSYIASQGPLPTTFTDFWRMVWENNTVVICMITNLTERGRRKCDQYWPSDGEATYGGITVKLMNVLRMAHYSIRVFTIKNTKVKKKQASERIVYQYHYTDWPDHGVPNFTLPVLMYVRKSAAASPESAGPIVIHCSAGVGRTGTYIMLDTMMRQIKDKQSVNVYGFLSHIRNQRNYLVQTEDQYIFIHDALVEFIKSGETEIKDCNIPKYMEELLGTGTDAEGEGEGETLLQQQFNNVTSFQPKDFHIHSAMQAVNKDKNRSLDIIPVELTRVRLPAQPGEDGSDYINASFLQGYNRNDEYIITQHPLPQTVNDFWRLVWDQNSMTVLLLSESTDEDFPVFWPLKDEAMECGPFNVTLTEETHHLGYVTRDFILQSTQKTLQEYYECNTRIFSASMWPDSCTPLSQAFELVQTIKNWHSDKQETDGPVIIVDKFGGTEAALFCGLSTLQDQLQQEGSVDVYGVGSLYHLKRPGIFRKLDDFYLLYKAVDSICDDSLPAGDRDSGISNCNNYPNTMPSHFTSNSLSNHTETENGDVRKETTM